MYQSSIILIHFISQKCIYFAQEINIKVSYKLIDSIKYFGVFLVFFYCCSVTVFPTSPRCSPLPYPIPILKDNPHPIVLVPGFFVHVL